MREVLDMEEKQTQNVQEANTRLEKLALIEHWNNPMIILMPKQNEFFMDGVMEVFVTIESFEERLKSVPEDARLAYSKIPVVLAIDAVCKNECKGMLIRGLDKEEIYITREELMPLKEEADTIIMLQAVKGRQITAKRGIQILIEKKKKFYMLGEIPHVLKKEDDFFQFDITKISGADFDAVKLYMTKERAEKNNVRNFEIHCYAFEELARYFKGNYGLAIEPQQGFAVVFAPGEL